MLSRAKAGHSLTQQPGPQAKRILMGAPCSHQLTWAEKDGRSPSNASRPLAKAFEEFIFGPRTLVRTWGTHQDPFGLWTWFSRGFFHPSPALLLVFRFIAPSALSQPIARVHSSSERLGRLLWAKILDVSASFPYKPSRIAAIFRWMVHRANHLDVSRSFRGSACVGRYSVHH